MLQELHKGSPERSSRLQCLGSERDSSESSKDADHESPVSVLEVPFPADPSGYSCIERVNAEFHGMKLKLNFNCPWRSFSYVEHLQILWKVTFWKIDAICHVSVFIAF